MTAPPSKDDPIWPGCAVCLWKRDKNGKDPIETPPGKGIYTIDDGGGFHCSLCDRDVERIVDTVELLTNRRGPDDSDTDRVLLDRVVGYFPPNHDYPPEAREFADAQWLYNVRAILTDAQLLDDGSRPVKIAKGDAETI